MLEDLLKGDFLAGGEPFYNKASKDIGVLMFHGLTSTPCQVKELGDSLYKRGISNFGAMIAGHGTKKEDLTKSTREDWLNSAREAYEEFSDVYEKIIVFGFSLGGLLTLNLAGEYNPDVAIIASTPYKLDYKGNFKTIFGISPKESSYSVGYRGGIPTRTRYEIVRFVGDTRKSYSSVECPLFIIHGTADRRISSDSYQRIFDGVKTEDKKVLILPGIQHKVLDSGCKQLIFNEVYRFILRYTEFHT